MKTAAQNDGPTSNYLGVGEGLNGDLRRYPLRRSRCDPAREHGAGLPGIAAQAEIGKTMQCFAVNMTLAVHGGAVLLFHSCSDIMFEAAPLRDHFRSGTGLHRPG